ncbi:MAG TPA: hypothetical protein VK939_18175, partial [Longimicrobiales bacterium]|nr:hypothetical protein [Longimicrobiales bacterium]
EVRLRVLDHGEATVYDSGEFEVQLSGQPPEVRVEVIGPELEVLYPVGGTLAVPRDPAARVSVVVGKPERAYINDLLAERFVRLEAALGRHGVHYNASVDSLGEGVRRIIGLLELREEDLRRSIDRQRRQSDVKPAIYATIDRYLLEVKDLRDAVRLVVPFAGRNREAAVTLQGAMKDYNAAYEAVNDGHNGFLSGIRSFWEPARAEVLVRDLDDVYTEIMHEIHRTYVLPLNESLVVLQRAHGPGPPGGREIDAAVAAAQASVPPLDGRIEALERRYARLREALERD